MKFSIKNEIRFFYDALMRYASFFGSFVFWMFTVTFLLIFNQWLFAAKFTAGTIISMIVEYATKLLYKEKRPDFKDVKPTSLFEKFQEGGSFPSGHSANISLFTTLLYLQYGFVPLTMLFVVMTLLTGLSRMYLKRHYPKDVLGGYILGVVVGYLIA